MDYIDYINGQTAENFWFKGKKGLINILLKKLKTKNIRILDVGAGLGIDLDILNKYGELYVIDINKRALDLIPNNSCKEKKISSITNISYPDNFFDVVCSFDVFEHIKNDNLAVSEVLRVLKKRGHLLFTVPALQFLYSAHDRALLHLRRYTKKSIRNLLKDFKILKLYYWNSLLFFPLSILRIVKKKSKPKTDYFDLPSKIESLFIKLLKFENYLIKKEFKMPIGLSIVGYCRK